MRVLEHHLARAAIANNAANARQGDIQPHGLWHLWSKKSKLHLAGAAWLCLEALAPTMAVCGGCACNPGG